MAGSNGSQYVITFSGAGTVAGSGNGFGPNGSGAVIDDGLFILTTVASQITANSQNMASNYSTEFWKLYGSLSADNSLTSGTIGYGNSEVFVDAGDYNAFKSTFGSESDLSGPPVYNPYMDSNLDGYIDACDFNAFNASFGTDWSF